MSSSVLIIGEDPSLIDFDAPDAPPDMSAAKVMEGLEGSRDRLRARGFEAEILLTGEEDALETQVGAALARRDWTVIVIGAGLRVLPPMAQRFEQLMNLLHEQAPAARFAFNSQPDDSDIAALRRL